MIAGQIRKFLAEVTLLGQPFIKDDKMTVGKLVSSKVIKLFVSSVLKWVKV